MFFIIFPKLHFSFDLLLFLKLFTVFIFSLSAASSMFDALGSGQNPKTGDRLPAVGSKDTESADVDGDS